MNNVCRPIILYNVNVPARVFTYEWKYTAFGNYDGIDVRDNIWKLDSETNNFQVLMDQLEKEAFLLNGDYSKEVIFAARNEDNGEDEKFWKDPVYPFVFFVSLYMNGRAKNWGKLCRHIEKCIMSSEYGDDVMALCYQTLDNSDILLVLKAKSYVIGTDIISLFHDEDNRFIYDYDGKGSFESISLHYSYTICGFNRDIELEEKYKDEKIEEVSFYAFEKKPGSIKELFEELETRIKKAGAEIDKLQLLGSNDERIIIRDITWGAFMELFSRNNPLLTNEVKIYCDAICYGSTQLNHKKNSHLTPEMFGSRSGKEKEAERIIDNTALGLEIETIEKLKETVRKNDSDYIYEREYVKAISHIWNAMQKFSNSEFPSYIYTAIIQPMDLFLRQLIDYRNGKLKDIEFCKDNKISDFLNAVSLVIQNTSRINRDFLQTPEFNAVINDVPVKLYAFYAAWAYKVSRLLNTNNAVPGTKKADKQYSILICPSMEKNVEIEMLFPKLPPENRMLLVKTPERTLYNPEFLCNVLVHEISHYVGDNLRQRDKRYSAVVDIYSEILIQTMKKFYQKQITLKIKSEMRRKIPNLVKKIMDDHIENNKERWEKYTDYQYYTDFLKKTSEKVFDKLVEEFKSLYQEIEAECLRPSSCENRDIKSTFYSEEYTGDLIKTYEKSKRAKENEEGFRKYIESEKKEIIGNINNIAKETYADLICILLLETPCEVYLKNIYNSIREWLEGDNKYWMDNNIVNFRVGIILKCMQSGVYVMDKSVYMFQHKWDDDLLRKLYEENKGDEDYQYWLRKLSDLMLTVYKGPFDPVENHYLYNSKIWNSFVDYLMCCRKKFDEWAKSDPYIKNELKKLRASYEAASKVEDLEDTLAKIREFIEDSKIDLKNEFICKKKQAGTSAKVDSSTQSVDTVSNR